MYLYLQHGKKLSSISGIHLKDFHTPAVEQIEIDLTVEPAIWFKTLIINSVLIECDVRNVYWREKCTHGESETEFDTESTRVVPRMTRAVYDEGDCEDFELFDSVVKLLNKVESKSLSEEQRAQEILRILHLYVLPEIVLKLQDVALLQDALENVEHSIGIISEDIQRKDRGICLTENSLKTQRDKLFSLDNFESEKYLITCNDNFLREVLVDVERDIESMNYELESRQAEVERIRDAVTDEGKENLQKIRNVRDEIFISVQKYQSVRETIKNVTVRENRSKRRSKVTPNVFHEIYLELKGRLLKEKKIVKNCCDQKLKIASVREAIMQVRDELLQRGESYGFQTSREGPGTSTDVLETSDEKPSKWQTVEDKVKSTLFDGSSGPALAFKSFCDSVTTKITAFMKENEFFLNSRDPDETCIKGKGEDDDEFVNISYLDSIAIQHSQTIDNRISSGYRPFTNAIKEDILKHIEEQSKWLMTTMDIDTYMEKGKLLNVELPHKVWICYEVQLYGQIMNPLAQLYRESYSDVANKLYEFLLKKSLLELGIDEPWLNEECIESQPDRFESNRGACAVAKKGASLKSGLSITLGRMTLDELYQSAKNDCQDIPSFIDCPLDDERNSDVFYDQEESESNPSSLFENGLEKRSDINENDRASLYAKVSGEQPTINEVLQPAGKELEHCIETAAVVEKLKCMTRAYRLVNRKVTKLKSRKRPSSIESMVCCDEILSASIVLLTLLRKENFIQLYSHLNLLIDLMPSFLTGSVHDCSLTNFYSSFQYLFDKMVSVNRVSR
ncbi:unnamed protein product [Mytilus coruscus]|uniref:VPS9 domain-containing protein n=1 Tax=Mytilus coruscus TaxID=42192 RepID=A0A6J8EUA0_MYTCO|nr:unnamed protein product [Mytilus coruscus]